MGWLNNTTPARALREESTLDGIALMDRAIATVRSLKPASALELTRLLSAHIRHDRPEISEADATALVLNASADLYRRYQRESVDGRYALAADGVTPIVYDTARPDAVNPTAQATANGVDIIDRVRRAVDTLRANNPLLSEAAAVAQVFQDRNLYDQYCAAVAVVRT